MALFTWSFMVVKSDVGVVKIEVKPLGQYRGTDIEVFLISQQKYLTLRKRVQFLFNACWKYSTVSIAY